jgi:hypothetical protein
MAPQGRLRTTHRLCPALALAAAWLWPLVAAAQAQPPTVVTEPAPAAGSEAVKSVVGAWELSNAERDRSCVVTLRTPAAGGSGAIAWDGKCAEAFAFAREARSWKIGEMDAIQMFDAKGQMVIELTEVEGGLYEGERRGEGIIFLQSAASGAAEALKPAAFVGDWAFTGANGRATCRVTFADTPAQDDAFALKLKPGCSGAAASFAPVAWRLDRTQLVLVPANGDVWRFEESEPGVWIRIPEQRQPLRLVKQ